jgi:hypothetical protein
MPTKGWLGSTKSMEIVKNTWQSLNSFLILHRPFKEDIHFTVKICCNESTQIIKDKSFHPFNRNNLDINTLQNSKPRLLNNNLKVLNKILKYKLALREELSCRR